MNPLLNKFDKKKARISALVFLVFVFCLSFLVHSVNEPSLGILHYPLKFFTLIRREILGIVFYHRNFIQNEKLKREAELLKARLASQTEIYLENMRLKDALYFKHKSAFKIISARVIGRQPDSWSSSIIADKGKNDGVRKGMAVITPLGLAGRVIEAGRNTSKILLLSDPGFGVSGLIQRSRQEGLVSGTLGNHLIMKYLPRDTDVKIGDTVITSGFNGTYPKGILIGTIIDVGKEFSGLTSFAVVRPAAMLSRAEEVLIISE